MKLRIAIIGLGLIGGSLGLALKQNAGESLYVIGMDCDQDSCNQALACGAVDSIANEIQHAVSSADVIFYCTPVLQIAKLVRETAGYFKAGAIVSDVGSTKSFLQETLIGLLPPGVCYIGGHPMAGREKSGFPAADKNLFKDKFYILTPAASTPPEAVDILSGIVSLTGARLALMEVEKHDESAALISHIPHVAAAALVNLLGRYPGREEELLNLAGGGFCDTTRIASSNADMWADICLTNFIAIDSGINELISILQDVKTAIGKKDRDSLHSYFRQAKARRDSIIASL